MLKNERGFTMIELLLVLVGAVLFVSIGLSTSRTIGKMQLSMVARDIQSLIRQSQDRAYGEQNTYDIYFQTLSGRCIQIKDNKAIKTITMPSGITIELTNFPRGTLRFKSNLTPSGGGTVLLSSKAHKVKMTVLPVTGRVKIYPVARR